MFLQNNVAQDKCNPPDGALRVYGLDDMERMKWYVCELSLTHLFIHSFTLKAPSGGLHHPIVIFLSNTSFRFGEKIQTVCLTPYTLYTLFLKIHVFLWVEHSDEREERELYTEMSNRIYNDMGIIDICMNWRQTECHLLADIPIIFTRGHFFSS